MKRRRQLRDAILIDDLSRRSMGEMTIAAILHSNKDRPFDVTAASSYLASNPLDAKKSIIRNPAFNWIIQKFDEISAMCIEIEADKIFIFDSAKQNASKIFDDKIDNIRRILKADGSFSITYYISEIFADETRYGKYNAPTLACIRNVKLLTDDISKAIWRIKNPWYYILVDVKFIAATAALFLFSIPMWYFFGAHNQEALSSGVSPQALISNDIAAFKQLLADQEVGIISRSISAVHSIWELLFVVPSLFLAPPAISGLLRRRMRHKSDTLDKYEALFNDIGNELRKIAPSRSSFISLRLKMTNNAFAVGSNIQQYVDTMIISSFNSVKGNYDNSVENFLNEVGQQVRKSKNPDAADHYKEMIANLKANKPSMAKTLWNGLVVLVPGVGKILGAAEVLAKLFPPSNPVEPEEV